jgi:formate dehydrogenase major subunit
VNETFVRERCEHDAFEHWADFVSHPKNSPEVVAKITGVPAEHIRQAARLYATGGNGAIYYGLGVIGNVTTSCGCDIVPSSDYATGAVCLWLLRAVESPEHCAVVAVNAIVVVQ